MGRTCTATKEQRMRWWSPRVLGLLGVGGVSSLCYAQEVTVATYPRVFFPLFGLYVLALVVVWRKRSGPSCLVLIVAWAIVFRVLVVASPVVLSSDLYRYIWDGRVQLAGFNPYRYPPAAEALTTLRDAEIYPRINRPWVPTIYPPGAQILFAMSAVVFPDSITGLKSVMVLFDIATLLLLIRLLQGSGNDPERALLYAWSPLVVFEFAGSGHVDALMLPCLLLALLARLADRAALTGVMLGVATLIKLYPAVLLPIFYKRRERWFPGAFGITLVLGYLPYVWGVREKVVGYLPRYFGPWEAFNGGLQYFLTAALTPLLPSARSLTMLGLAGLFLAVVLRLGWHATDQPVPWRAYRLISAYLLFVPATFYPWYMIWILPFLCLYPAWGWLYMSGALTLAYLAYVRADQSLPEYVRLIEYLPLYGLLLAQSLWRYWQGTRPERPGTCAMRTRSGA